MRLVDFKSSQKLRTLSTIAKNALNVTDSQHDITKLRNIGIAAHIDAGKTTTTERMLFYSGMIRSVGEVHRGDTVMDYMDQERERGITITSAAITFPWKNHKINLIDTPGHVDFTIEVERALRVLDGAVTILDSSAGVEAQTLTVWRQADRYQVPRIIYLNKMDKPNSNMKLCVQHLEKKLHCLPLVIHYPLGDGKNFHGFVDLVQLTSKMWDLTNNSNGRLFISEDIMSSSNASLREKALELRADLVGKLSDLDEMLAESVLTKESVDKITSHEIEDALRRVTLKRTGFPVLCGSSYRNIGVQPLLDAVISYLPSPADRQLEFVKCYEANKNLCAMAFKIQSNVQRGLMTYLRLYSGNIESGQKIYNVTQGKSEKIGKLYVASADEVTEISSASGGDIVVATGLKDAITGDTITSSLTAVTAAKRWVAQNQGVPESEVAPVLAGVQLPDPVFFCSVEPPSLAYQKALETALENLQREDPSLKVRVDPETGQTVIAGMGELHLEIVLDRIKKEYKVDAALGPLQVAYKETALADLMETYVLDKTLSGTKHFVKVTMSLEPNPLSQETPALSQAPTREAREQLASVWANHLKAVEQGVQAALSSGPLLGFPVVGVRIYLHSLEVGPRTSITMLSAAASQCVNQLLRNAGTRLMEPFMKLEVVVEEQHLHSVLGDLSQRRADVLEVGQRGEAKVVLADCPLAELRGYSTHLRTLTSGLGTFSMEFSSYKPMTTYDQQKAVQEITGIIV